MAPSYKVPEVKAALQLVGKDKAYLRLCKELAAQMLATSWVNKTVSGEAAFKALCDWISKHIYIKAIRPTWKDPKKKNPKASQNIQKAVQALIADVGSKEKKSAGAGKQNFDAMDAKEEEDSGSEVEVTPMKRR
jgi:hypothetical protein